MTLQLTQNNHVAWGWEGFPDYVLPSQAVALRVPFRFKVGGLEPYRKAQSFRNECVFAIQEMNELYGAGKRNIVVGISGGIDSQVILHAAKVGGVKVIPLIMSYMHQGVCLNSHDIEEAYITCEKLGLTPLVEYIDTDFFFMDVDFIHEHHISDPAMYVSLKIAQKYSDTYFIMGGGDPVLYPNESARDFKWKFCASPHLQYFANAQQPGTTKFYWWSPQLMESMITGRAMDMILKALPTKVATFNSYCNSRVVTPRRFPYYAEFYNDWCKPYLYGTQWPEIQLRKKYAGFETFSTAMDKQYLARLASLFQPYKELIDSVYVEPSREEVLRLIREDDFYWRTNGSDSSAQC